MSQNKSVIDPPPWLLVELAYRCPLQYPYCSDPLDFARQEKGLTTEQWVEVSHQVRAMGSVQLDSSGGESLTCKDLPELIRAARDLGFYTNLVASGVRLAESRLDILSGTGLDHIRISLQASDEVLNVVLVGDRKVFQRKLVMARVTKARDYPMVLNFVLHRHSIDQLDKAIELYIELEVDDVELATCQFYSWAFLNRGGLLPTREQITRAEQVVADYRQKMTASGNLTSLLLATPGCYEGRPEGCMGDWGSIFLGVTPEGTALPCHSARQLPVAFPSMLEQNLESIWYDPFGSNRYRRYDWTPELCRSRDEKKGDSSGYRCQVSILTGSVDNADPVCNKSPYHHKIPEARCEAARSDIKASQLQFHDRTYSQPIYKIREL